MPQKTYIPPKEVDFAGTSYLAGPKSGVGDELVLVPAKYVSVGCYMLIGADEYHRTGEVLIWDREYGVSGRDWG